MSLEASASLVGASASGCSGKLRVQACAPMARQSVLVDKITATDSKPPCGGQPMPRGGPPLSAADQRAIIDWVAQGAPK